MPAPYSPDNVRAALRKLNDALHLLHHQTQQTSDVPKNVKLVAKEAIASIKASMKELRRVVDSPAANLSPADSLKPAPSSSTSSAAPSSPDEDPHQ